MVRAPPLHPVPAAGEPVLLASPKVSPSPSADTFSDLTMARQGYPRMAFSACFGGIIFSILPVSGAGGGAWGRGCLSFPARSPGRAPAPGGPLGRIHPRVPGMLAASPVPAQCKGTGVVFRSCGDGTRSIAPSPQLSQPQRGGGLGWSLADLGSAKGKEGKRLCHRPGRLWVVPRPG